MPGKILTSRWCLSGAFWLRENSNHVTLCTVVSIVWQALAHSFSAFRSCRGVWGALGGSKAPQEEASSTAVEGTVTEAGHSGTAAVHSAPKPSQAAATGPAWGGAGLPARIQVCIFACSTVNWPSETHLAQQSGPIRRTNQDPYNILCSTFLSSVTSEQPTVQEQAEIAKDVPDDPKSHPDTQYYMYGAQFENHGYGTGYILCCPSLTGNTVDSLETYGGVVQ